MNVERNRNKIEPQFRPFYDCKVGDTVIERGSGTIYIKVTDSMAFNVEVNLCHGAGVMNSTYRVVQSKLVVELGS